MSVVTVTEINRQGSNTWKRERTYTRTFLVETSAMTDDVTTVGSATGIPTLLSSYPTDAFARCTQITCTQKDMSNSPFLWTVAVEYKSKLDMDPDKTDENPTARVPIWEFTFEKGSKAVRYDLDGNPINNSAETPFDPPLELELAIPIIKVTYNVLTFDYDTVSDAQDCINDATWNGFAEKTVKVRGLDVKEKYENNVVFWEVVATFAVKWDEWQPKVLDQGYFEIVAGNRLLIRDKYQNPLPHPSMLDGSGGKLALGGTPVFLEFTMLRELDFTTTFGF